MEIKRATQPRRPQRRATENNGADRRKKRHGYGALTRRLFIATVCLAVALAAAAGLKFYYSHLPSAKKLQSYLDSATYLNGVSIAGKNVTGMTLAEARDAIAPILDETAKGINISVSLDPNLWVFTAADMHISAELETVLADAMLYGRGNTPAANKEAKKALAEARREFPVAFAADSALLAERIQKIAAVVDTPATEPSAEADVWAASPVFTYHEGSNGHVLDQAGLMQDIMSALAEGDYARSIHPELIVQEQQHSMEWLQENTKLRASWQTSFGGSSSSRNASRVGNIQKAATLLNGCRVEVGEEFNFNGFIGPRTESGGWPLAPGIVNGNTYELQAGGGICQVSTTLYNALLSCGDSVEITERYHHSWPSSYADIGLDSTVTGTVESGKSLNFINNTGAPLYIFAYCNQDDYLMDIYIYGEPLESGVTYKPRGEVVETIEPGETTIVENSAWPLGYEEKTISARKGYKSDVYLDKFVNGTLDSSAKLYTDSYRAVAGTITKGTGDPSLPKPTSSK